VGAGGSLLKVRPLCRPSPSALIRLFPVEYGKNEDNVLIHPEYDPIVADSKFSVRFERFSKGFRVILRPLSEPCFNRSTDALLSCSVYSWKIASFHLRMISELVAHSAAHVSSCEMEDSGS
jgi:hypothetical protein